MKLSEITCAHCEGAGLELHAEGAVVCRYCGTPNTLDGALCPRCDEVNSAGTDICGDCRQSLTRTCPACGTKQWSGAERCGHCGRALDALALASGRWGVNPANRLNEQAQAAVALKASELADGLRRTATFEAIEQRRQAFLAEARRRRAAQQRVMFSVLGIGVIGFVVFVVVILVAAALGN